VTLGLSKDRAFSAILSLICGLTGKFFCTKILIVRTCPERIIAKTSRRSVPVPTNLSNEFVIGITEALAQRIVFSRGWRLA
jgi:hypothetical protein